VLYLIFFLFKGAARSEE